MFFFFFWLKIQEIYGNTLFDSRKMAKFAIEHKTLEIMVNRNEKSVIRLETVQVFFSYYEISTVNKIVEMLQNSRFMSHAWLE